MIDRYGLGDVYTLSTDITHDEGDEDPIGRMGDDVARLGANPLERNCVGNAALLLSA